MIASYCHEGFCTTGKTFCTTRRPSVPAARLSGLLGRLFALVGRSSALPGRLSALPGGGLSVLQGKAICALLPGILSFHGLRCVSLELYGFPLVPMQILGFLWTAMDFYVFLWVGSANTTHGGHVENTRTGRQWTSHSLKSFLIGLPKGGFLTWPQTEAF